MRNAKLAAVAVVLALIALPTILFAGSPSEGTDDPKVVDGREIHFFEDLETMVATSDLVVIGTVTEARPGRIIGRDAESQLRMRLLTLEVEDVLHGTYQEQLPLMVEELAWGQGGPIMLNGQQWAEVGDRSLFFLTDVEGGLFQAVSTQGRYVIERGGLRSPVIHSARTGELFAEMESLSMEQARDRVSSSSGN